MSNNLVDALDELVRSGLAADPSPARIVLPVFRLREVIWERDKEIARQHGLTWADFKLLSALRHAPKPGYKPSDLYRLLSITSGGLTKVLQKLEGQGLLKLMRNEDDARSHFIVPTSKGRRLAERVIAQFETENHGRFAAALTTEEQAQLSHLLLKFLSGLEASEQKLCQD